MNEEKKLTDEEIIKAFEQCNTKGGNCHGCAYAIEGDDDIRCRMRQMRIDTLDLIKRLQSEVERYKAVNKLLEQDIADLHAEREKRVEAVYADFMQDYKIMRDELNECYDENGRLREALRSIPQAICDNTYPDFDKAGKPVNVWKAREGYDKIDEIIKAVDV